MLLKEQNFGVEIELIGITRENAAAIIACYFGTASWNAAGVFGYSAWAATDRKGRTWKCVSDGSLNDRSGGCEVVTPILQYEDIEDLQKIVRLLRENGAKADSSCGIHVHVDASRHTVDSLQRLMNFAVGRQDLFYEALNISSYRSGRFCKKMNKNLLTAMKHDNVRTKDSVERIWYSSLNDGYTGTNNRAHYNVTRYHGINLHAFFTKGTVEFRLFNGTTHAGKIKAYIQFCLAMSAWAIEAKETTGRLFFKSAAKLTKEQKRQLMLRVLKNRLGLKGWEFRTARLHLTAAFRTDGSNESAA
jgi:hypothetical protein